MAHIPRGGRIWIERSGPSQFNLSATYRGWVVVRRETVALVIMPNYFVWTRDCSSGEGYVYAVTFCMPVMFFDSTYRGAA